MANESLGGRWRNDDDALLAALDRAIHPTTDVPASFLQAAYGCYTWHRIEAELAALAYDSALDDAELACLRAEPATLRSMTFQATTITFELEVMPDGLAGQLIPPQAGELQLESSKGEIVDVPTNADGYFRIRPAPSAPFRLRCRQRDGQIISTNLITL
ncbi:MAG TPA: hypothetical protein VFM37_05540 [Pseudonocardiaceae bacterium]|nr:hypothetical protein [Pseudonocardiaceae bacterium]